MYGEIGWEKYVDPKQLNKWALDIASGKFGTPDDGMEQFNRAHRDAAEKVAGSNAYVDAESERERQKAFMNRPENKFEDLTKDSREWLGQSAMPDDGTLKKWAGDLVAENKSQ